MSWSGSTSSSDCPIAFALQARASLYSSSSFATVHHALWRDIDFAPIKDQAKALVTDERLSNLLVRVNAHAVTRSLNLSSCDEISGTGLEPLRGSETLEEINLRYGYRNNQIVFDHILPILRSMLPFKLSRVRVITPLDDFPETFKSFLRDLHDSQQRKALEEELACTACANMVVDDTRQSVANRCGLPFPGCDGCQRSFCGHGSCPAEVLVCNSCSEVSCGDCTATKERNIMLPFLSFKDCEVVRKCSSCHVSFCYMCRAVKRCDGCSQNLCSKCDEVVICSECDKARCTDCNIDQHGDSMVYYCVVCEESYCRDCRQADQCDDCESRVCDDCRKCSSCEKLSCTFCSPLVFCKYCSLGRCDTCTRNHRRGNSFTCDECNSVVCQWCCDEIEYCDRCQKWLCEDCRTVDDCTICNMSICEECDTLEKCGACNELCCGRCRPQRSLCDVCQSVFCNDDCAFVDFCEQCDTSCCQDCGVVVRCAWCGVASCGDCKSSGNVCCNMSTDDKPAPKKARTEY